MVNYSAVYRQAAQDFLRMSGQKAYAVLERMINRAEHCIHNARTSGYDSERVDSIDSFVEFFSKGLPEVMHHAPITSHNWLVQNYGATFTLGLADPTKPMALVLQSKPTTLTPTHAELGIHSLDNHIDLLLDTYESALQRQLVPPPRALRLNFGRHTVIHQGKFTPEMHRFVKVMIQI